MMFRLWYIHALAKVLQAGKTSEIRYIIKHGNNKSKKP